MTQPTRLVLESPDVDLVEALLCGYVTNQDVAVHLPPDILVQAEGVIEVEFCDEENTPIALGQVVAEHADTEYALTSLVPQRPLAQVNGVIADPDVRVSAARLLAQQEHGRPVVVIDGFMTSDDLAPYLSAEVTPLWVVAVARSGSGLGPGSDVAQALAALIRDRELVGDLVVVANPASPVASKERYLQLRDPTWTLPQALENLGISPVHKIVGTLRQAIGKLAPQPVVTAYLRSEAQHSARGAVVMFTGLSGSGKSTVAKAFAQRVTSSGTMPTVLIDGDEARQLLSAGLGFDRASRDLNIERLGYVATQCAGVGGLAVLAPIAPFDEARKRVRRRAEDVAEFILVHISTPLEVCEQRDRKGLYAQARAGAIAEFTGISSPYEVPDDADIAIDTSNVDIDSAVDMVWQVVANRLGWH